VPQCSNNNHIPISQVLERAIRKLFDELDTASRFLSDKVLKLVQDRIRRHDFRFSRRSFRYISLISLNGLIHISSRARANRASRFDEKHTRLYALAIEPGS
jgi:hypothetical protein